MLVWGLAYALGPMVLKSQFEKIGSEKLGRQVTIGQVDFKPWSLELAVADVRVAKTAAQPGTESTASPGNPGNPGNAPQLKIDRLYIDAELASLVRLAPVIDRITVDAPTLHLTHLGAGRYDIDDILERFQPAADQPASDPARFALYNLALHGGQVDFDDRPVGRTHQMRELELTVPFLSNLESQRDVSTEPRLAFLLNGSRFDTAAVGTPFAQTRKTDATFTLRDFDLQPYLAYWPASLPFTLQSAVLNADTRIAFEQTPSPAVRMSGTVTADGLRLVGKAPVAASSPGAASPSRPAQPATAKRELLAFDRLRVGLEDVRPFEQVVRLSSIELSSPTVYLSRDRAGRLNWLFAPVAALSPTTGDSPVTAGNARPTPAASSPVAASSAAGRATLPPGKTPWKIQVANASLTNGSLHWLDETLSSPAEISLAGLVLNASAIAFPFAADKPLQFSGSLGLAAPSMAPTGSRPASAKARSAVAAAAPTAAANRSTAPVNAPAASADAQLTFSGSATDQAGQLTATVSAWPLNMATRYVGQFLLPALNGQLDAQLALDWKAAQAGQPSTLKLAAPQLSVRDVLLAEGRKSLVSIRRVDLAQVDVDVAAQSFTADRMQLTQPKAQVSRDADKRWMYERWMVARGIAPPPPAKSAAGQASQAAAPSWRVAIREVGLDAGAVSFSDRAGSKPVDFEVSGVQVKLGNLVLDERAASSAAKPMPLSASLRLGAGRFEPGKLDFRGSLGLAPVQAQGRLVVEHFPVQAFEPYFADTLNIELLRADAGFRGRVAFRETPAGPSVQVAGDVSLEEFRANTLAPSEDLLAWKALNLRGLNVALDPARATRVDVRETVLTDFFARVIVMPDGRINLQDLVRPSGIAAASTTPSQTITAAVPAPAASGARVAGSARTTVAAAPPPQAVKAGPSPVVNFGPMSLVNGKVLFSDRFVKPNYSANLSDLSGRLGAFSSIPTGASGTSTAVTAAAPGGTTSVPAFQMADLELRGRAEGTASLEIVGKLNPLAKPLALDIEGRVRDLELPPLSPYAIKYSGYGINRGKMSVDVKYVVLPDGRLTAANKLVLNQLSFGDKVEGSTASLPVKLAVALLADRNGVIDLDLPISGSLNDPQFSIGPIIIKVIFNVITKAITAPFSLLAGAFGGGGEELSMVSFQPGSAALGSEARGGLDKVAKALTDRPALKLTVTGTSSVEAERDGFKRERLAELVRAEKRRQTVKDGGTTTAVVSVGEQEYPALLKEVYKRADMPKPRNLVGMAKDLPAPEMENLLLADIQVSDDAMRELAVRRGVAVKDYLATQGLSPDRLFLGAAKSVPPEARWTPRAELNLATP